MTMIIEEPTVKQRLIAERQASGLDRSDEVWEGTYIIMPLPNLEHQQFVAKFAHVLISVTDEQGLGVTYPSCNVSDRDDQWEHNYRCPDVAVYLNSTSAVNCHTHMNGGPDFAIEITSPGDRTRDKLDFYAAVGTGELLIIDREPWALELHRLEREVMNCVGRCEPGDETTLRSEVVPLTWQLETPDPRPTILITHHDGEPQWRA